MARLFVLAAFAAVGVNSQADDTVIRSGVAWFDTAGNRIYAGGANIYYENGTYYLVGEGQKVHADCSECFNLYSSPDLGTWTFIGCVLKNEDIVAPQPGTPYYRMERPKILKCPSTQKYVMWFHCDTPGFTMRSVGVLTADAVEGPYSFASPCFRPDGRDSYDMGTFVDATGDGRGYLIRSVENTFAGISQMTLDCLNVTGIISQGPDMEGQAIMRDSQGILHAAGSHLTGWAANAAQFVTTNSTVLKGALWMDNYNPSGNPTTYDSQSTFIFPYVHADGHTTFMWMADRWNANGPGGLDNMTNIWLPLVFNNASLADAPGPGSVLFIEPCNAADPTQIFSINAGNSSVTHVATGLCVIQTGGSGSQLSLAACSGVPEETWVPSAGSTLANGLPASNSDCLNFNNVNNVLPAGNPVIAYTCDDPPHWNEQWALPQAGVPGVLQALAQSGSPSGMCATVGAAPPPQAWSLPWLAAWSLKDY